MKKMSIMILTAALLACSCMIACAEDKPKAQKSRKDITKEDLVSHIEGRLDTMEEALNLIPGLKKENNASGMSFYSYNGVKLKDLDRDTLDKLFSRVQNEGVRIQTERLNKQLEGIRQAHQAQVAAQQVSRIPRVIQPPPQPPSSQAQHQIPSVPQPPPEPPKR